MPEHVTMPFESASARRLNSALYELTRVTSRGQVDDLSYEPASAGTGPAALGQQSDASLPAVISRPAWVGIVEAFMLIWTDKASELNKLREATMSLEALRAVDPEVLEALAGVCELIFPKGVVVDFYLTEGVDTDQLDEPPRVGSTVWVSPAGAIKFRYTVVSEVYTAAHPEVAELVQWSTASAEESRQMGLDAVLQRPARVLNAYYREVKKSVKRNKSRQAPVRPKRLSFLKFLTT